MSRKALFLPLLLVPFLALAALGRPTANVEERVRYLRIGVDASGERGFDVGAALAAMLSRPPGLPACAADRACGVPGLVALAQSQPSRHDIVAAVTDGRVETGLAPADQVYAARCFPAAGTKPADLTIIGEIYNEALHALVRAETGLTGIAQLRGRRVAMGIAGSDERRLAERMLAAHGLRMQDVKRVEIGGDAAVLALADGRIDALFRIAAAPDPSIAMAISAGARLVPVADDGGRLSGLHPFGAPGLIQADTYGEGHPAVSTLMQPVVWVAGPALSPDLAGQLVAALANKPNRTALTRGGPHVELLRPAALRMSAPLHPAAGLRYGVDPIAMACPARSPR